MSPFAPITAMRRGAPTSERRLTHEVVARAAMPKGEHRRQIATHDECSERCFVLDGVLDHAARRAVGAKAMGVHPASHRSADHAVDELLVTDESGVLGDPVDRHGTDTEA